MLSIKSADLKKQPVITGRAVKALLYNLDGNISEMVLLTPVISMAGETLEKANYFIREYINSLTVNYITIERFETIMGNILSDGTFDPICLPINHEVPLNKIFNEGKMGSWVSPEDHPGYSSYYDNMKGGSAC